ncbi:hypothetical protein GUITHDRAFT_145235 [Guillardia theta CCMP2712]|uniref:Uncharacterized protein n=1 Tax=Guillardia theta (strain CCMP2712) TaxID=905079 RepID=L1ILX7_GUITC|nr:hypothetical protein GUITHDRAFT_145235 [Guillardia theta CCMP2712]EKX37132.1 hypothetical protein GUITHDRAFT_145235 [Guillardia theta CCMP2712]|eukprot:XP_005824112.1 hypothetical protein GUITHDRAFT_145235 [Guillardia theta CCMP2712]
MTQAEVAGALLVVGGVSVACWMRNKKTRNTILNAPIPRQLDQCKNFFKGSSGSEVKVHDDALVNCESNDKRVDDVGAENQCFGLLRHLQILSEKRNTRFRPIFVRVVPRYPLALLPNSVQVQLRTWMPQALFATHFDALQKERVNLLSGPFSGLVIASGRTTVLSSLYLRETSGNSACSIQIQQPHCSTHLFDAVVSPIHDVRSYKQDMKQNLWKLRDNQLFTIGSLHDVEPVRDEDRKSSSRHLCQLLPHLQQQTGPPASSVTDLLVSILIGSPTSKCPWTFQDLTGELQNVVQQLLTSTKKTAFFVTLSRRTSWKLAQEIEEWLERKVPYHQRYLFSPAKHDGRPNPYTHMLHGSQIIVITADSVSMASEASSTGKQVIIACRGRVRGKFVKFFEVLEEVMILR